MMEQTVEESGDRGGISEELAPIIDETVRGEAGCGALVATHHDELPEILSDAVRLLPHAEVVDDHQRHAGEILEVSPPGAAEGGISSFLDQVWASR